VTAGRWEEITPGATSPGATEVDLLAGHWVTLGAYQARLFRIVER
jgi:hypothetical protein